MRIIDQVLQTLNSAAHLDPGAFAALLEHRVPCSHPLAEHPTVVVGSLNANDPDSPPVVGMMGVLNSIVEELSVAHGEGRQRIAYRIFDSEYANKAGTPLKDLLFVPYTWRAGEQIAEPVMELTELDVEVIGKFLEFWKGPTNNPLSMESESSYWPDAWRNKDECPERDECIQKLIKLGLITG